MVKMLEQWHYNRDAVRSSKAAPADAGAGAAHASVAPPLPSRQWKVSLKDLGVARPIALRGVESEASVGVGVRRDEIVEAARLRLTFTLSPALIPVLSHLKVMLNDETLQTLVLDKERLGTPQTVELNIDPRYFTDYNRFRFQFIGHYYEGRKPAFVDDITGLIIGPLFVVTEAGFLLGLRPELEAQIEQRAGPTRSGPAGPAQAR